MRMDIRAEFEKPPYLRFSLLSARYVGSNKSSGVESRTELKSLTLDDEATYRSKRQTLISE